MATLVVAPAQAVVIDFESLAQNNTLDNIVGNPYTEDGFRLNNGSSGFPLQFISFGTLNIRYPGSTALVNGSAGGLTSLTQVGGGAFTLSSIDLTHFNNHISQFVSVSFTGRRADTTTVTQSFTTDSLPGLETFNFTNFTNLVAVDWGQPALGLQFDNINVTPTASSTAVPEPVTVLGTIFGAGYGVALKRKLARAKLDKQDIS